MGQTTRTIDGKPVIRRKLTPIPGKRGPGTGYRAEFAAVALGFCILGATHVSLAAMFGVDEDTITNWKRAHPAFRKAIEEGSHYADLHVANAFYRLCASGCGGWALRRAARAFARCAIRRPGFRSASSRSFTRTPMAALDFRVCTGYNVTTTKLEKRELRDVEGNVTGTVTITTTTEQHIPPDGLAGWRWLQLRQRWYVRPTLTVDEFVEITKAARAEVARRGIDIAAALAEVQEPGRGLGERCPTCGALRSAGT
jgi:hypothetical protein